MDEMVMDKWVADEWAYTIFEHPKELDEFRNTKLTTSLFILKLGKIPIWKPTKFKKTKKSDVADSMSEVLR